MYKSTKYVGICVIWYDFEVTMLVDIAPNSPKPASPYVNFLFTAQTMCGGDNPFC